MSSFFVGVHISGNHLRIAALDGEQKSGRTLSLSDSSFSSEEELAALLKKAFVEDFPRPHSVVAAVPACKGFFRRLEFPFGDPRKISSSLAFELGSHLPVDPGDCLTDFMKPKAVDDGNYIVPATAVPLAALEEFLAPFEKAGVPLNTLDLAPFAFAAGLDDSLYSSLLACVSDEEVTVALVEDGQIVDYCLRPFNHGFENDEALQFIHSRSLFFINRRGRGDLPLCLIGSGAGAELADALEEKGHRVVIEPCTGLEGMPSDRAFLPAVLLALRAKAGKACDSFNLRQGPLALKNDWSALKKQFVFSGALAALTLVVIVFALALNYFTRTSALKRLDQQILSIYQEAFPGSQHDDNILPRFQSHLIALEKKGAIFRVGSLPSPLEILKEISERLKGIPDLDMRSYFYDPENVRLEGTTTSFEAVNRMSSELKGSEFFQEIEIAEAKMSLDGKHVNFRLRLTLKGGLSES